jgi:6-phosphogluconolactonase
MMNARHQKTPQICRWHPYSELATLELAVINAIQLASKCAIEKNGAFHIVLSGGTTPQKIYELLPGLTTPWSSWHIYFGDERCLPVGHPDRNSQMANLAWLNHVTIPSAHIHPIPAEQNIMIAAHDYALRMNNIKSFDLVLLGLGEDGHTASLFPNHDLGNNPDSPATIVIFDAPKPPPNRISLSARRLSEANEVIFIVTGKSKWQAVQDWRSGQMIPAANITPSAGVDIYIESQLL